MSKRLYSGRYEFQEFIADGEMGAVYKAWDNTSFDHMVALQVIYSHLSSDASFIERFREAARKTAQLQAHPNIIKVFDVEHDHGIEYLVMEYFPSTNLRDHIRSHGKFHIWEATHVIRQIGEALSHTHSADLLHRNIKPTNILLDKNQHVKLTGYGIAKAMSAAQHTATGQLIGTLKYMSPEQARQLKLDERTDLYSLGIVFYELVTGKNLWDHIPNVKIYGNLQTEDSVPPLNFPPGVPQEIQEIIKDMLQFDPSKRVQNAQALLTRLENLEPILSNDSLARQEKDSDTTIVRIPLDTRIQQGDDTTKKIHHAPMHPSSTQEPPVSLTASVTKQPSDAPPPRSQDLEDDPAAKAKDPAKPYYFVDDSHSFSKHREEIEAKNPLFADQFLATDPHSSHSYFTIKKMVVVAFILFVGATLFLNQSFFAPSQPSQEELIIQEIEYREIQEKNEQDFLNTQTPDLNQQGTTTSNTQTTEIVQQTSVVPEVQTAHVTQQANTTDDAQITKLRPRTTAAANVQTEELAQQAKAIAETQAAERAKQAQATADAQAAKLAQKAQATADAKTAKAATEARAAERARLAQAAIAETQALMNLLEQLRGSVAKKDLSALKQLSTMSESRYRMLKVLFSRYRTVEVSIGDVIRAPARATATLQITKLIRPNGMIVQPHPIVQDIKVTVLKDKTQWNLPAW